MPVTISKDKIEVVNIEVTSTKIIVHCNFNYSNGCVIGWHKEYDHTAFSKATAINEAKAAYSTLEGYVANFMESQPADTVDW